jgi:cytochrome c5
MKKTLWTVTVMLAVVALCATGVLLAGEKKASGKELYRSYCKPCHDANSPNKKLVETHQGVEAPDQSGKKLLEVLDEEMLKSIRKFAVDHAADSESPMTCG